MTFVLLLIALPCEMQIRAHNFVYMSHGDNYVPESLCCQHILKADLLSYLAVILFSLHSTSRMCYCIL